MNNPLQTSGTDFRVQEPISKAKWKVFFWIEFIVLVNYIVFLALDSTVPTLMLAYELSAYSVILLGIFGYAYNKRIRTQNFWKLILPLAVIFDVYYLIFDEPWSFESSQEMFFLRGVLAVVILPFYVFQYVALYRYGFKAAEIWS